MMCDSNDRTTKPAAAVSPNPLQPYGEVPDMEMIKDPDLKKVLDHLGNLIEIIKDTEYVPKNILFVGVPQSGKSALMNLLHSAIQGRYEAITEPGSSLTGGKGSLTGHICYFPNMGLSRSSAKKFRQRYKIPDDCHLPTFIDMPGIETDVDVIKYVLCGAVPPDTELQRFMTGRAIAPCLDFNNTVSRRIDRVVFVSSLLKDVPEALFDKIVSVVRGCEGNMACIPYYLVLTHMDKVSEPRSEEVQATYSKLLDCLFLRGESTLRVHEVTNYSDTDPVDPVRVNAYATNLKKHTEALSVLCKVLSRKKMIIPPNAINPPVDLLTPYTDCFKRKFEEWTTAVAPVSNWRPNVRQQRYWLIAVFVSVVAFVFWILYRLLMLIKG